jgi:hypothetical protein
LLLPEDVIRCNSWRNGLLSQVFDLTKLNNMHLHNSSLTTNGQNQEFQYSHTLQQVELRAANRAPVEQLLLTKDELLKRQKEDEVIDEELLEDQQFPRQL